MSSGAREAVARAIGAEVYNGAENDDLSLSARATEAALAALAPIIAAEIRAWAKAEEDRLEKRGCYWASGVYDTAENLNLEAEQIASSICGGGEK